MKLGFIIALILMIIISGCITPTENCYNGTLKTIQDFSRTLEEVAATPGHIKNYNLAFPDGCSAEPTKVTIGDKEYDSEQLFLRAWAKPEFCATKCESSGSQCTILHYLQYEGQGMTECVNIPPETTFPSSAKISGECLDKSNETPAYNLIDIRVNIPEGEYLLQNKTQPNFTNPVICAYLKIDSNN